MPGSSVTFIITVETQTTEGLINDIVRAIPSALTFYRVIYIERHGKGLGYYYQVAIY